MERKRAFQMRDRFDRAKTPMGAVPISVIMGFDYPLAGEAERGGRGETVSGHHGGHTSPHVRAHSRGPPSSQTQRLNTDYMNVTMLERLPRSQASWPSSLTSPRSRAVSEVRAAAGSASSRLEQQTPHKYSTGFTSSLTIEHPKQQPCRYASALSMAAMSPTPRTARAATVMPSTRSSSTWRSTSTRLPESDVLWLSQHTKHNAQEIEEMYEGFLNDFHGGLDIEQFTNLFPDLNNGLATANLVFRVLDEDNSKKLGFKEFLQAIDLVGARTPDDKLRWAFKMYDEDNSREIDIEEMERVMLSIYSMLEGASVEIRGDPKEKARACFKRMDTSGDGKLSEDEFIKGAMEDNELMLMLDALFESMTGSGFLSQAEKILKEKET